MIMRIVSPPVSRFAAFAVLAVCVVACGKKAPPPAAAPYVKTVAADFGSITPSSSMSGLIAPYESVAIQSSLSEPTDAVNVQEGDRVTKGEVLAQLDTADLQAQLASDVATANSASANTTHTVYSGVLSIAQGNEGLSSGQGAVRQAQSTLTKDQQDLDRYQALFKQGYVSEQQYQDQLQTVRNDQGAVQAAIANLHSAAATVQANGPSLNAPGLQSSSVAASRAQEQVAQAAANQVRVSIAKATITSPIDGVVVNRNLNPGEYPGDRQIFTLQQVSPIFAILRGSGDQISSIGNGTTATITGTVVAILNQIQPGSTQFQVKVLLQNPNPQLRPGMPVQGQVVLPPVRGIRVPTTSFTDDDHDAVQIVQPDGTVKTVKVTEVADDGTTSIVTGVAAGMNVISNGQSSIGDGQKVSLKP
jgi:multidrug efflux pump subunit AcrA (membrane-fusion protein)